MSGLPSHWHGTDSWQAPSPRLSLRLTQRGHTGYVTTSPGTESDIGIHGSLRLCHCAHHGGSRRLHMTGYYYPATDADSDSGGVGGDHVELYLAGCYVPRPGRAPLSGTVPVDVSFVPGLRNRRAKGSRAMEAAELTGHWQLALEPALLCNGLRLCLITLGPSPVPGPRYST